MMSALSPNATLSPEMQLLCACCRVKPRAADLQLQAELATQINADKLLALAIRQRVEPLLYHNLKQHAQGVFPDQLMQALAARVRRNAVNSLNSIRINLQLVRLLRKHGIPFLPLKGVTLAQRYYGEIGLRHCNDIDFWVPVRSVEAVRSLLLEQGCRPDNEHNFQDIEERGEQHCNFLRRHLCHDIWIYPTGEHLEMHWRLTSNAKGLLLDPVDLLMSGDPIDVAGESMTMVGPAQLLLYLCEHGARHGWYRMKWLMDLPQVLESREWDWPQVLSEARRTNCLSALLLGLRLAKILFGWVVPELVAAAMKKHHFLSWQVKMVCQNLNKPEFAVAKPAAHQRVAHLLYRTSLMESFGFVWNELAYYFVSHNDLRIVRLPDRWFWAYYGLRPMLVWFEIFKHWQVRHAKQG